MSDFAIRVKQLPDLQVFDDNEHSMKAHLWNHFEYLIAAEKNDYKQIDNP